MKITTVGIDLAKNDAADAEAICEAVSRPSMRFVPIKSVEQQAVLSLHRARQGFVKARTAQANQIRGLLAEYGLIIARGIAAIARGSTADPRGCEQRSAALLPSAAAAAFAASEGLDGQAKELEGQITLWHRDNELSRKLAAVPGICPITASALVATVGDAKNFSNGRQLAAWLGLVPRQESSGGKTVLLGISKRGDAYLRTLLIHGARSVIYASGRRKESMNRWLAELIERRNTNLAAVALANKTARIAWALLARDRLFQPEGRGLSRISVSFERIHRSNLIGMGILPLRLPEGYSPASLALTNGDSLEIGADATRLYPGAPVPIGVQRRSGTGPRFIATVAVETALEIELLKTGGIVPYILGCQSA